ncbi:MAG: hypothetical protein PHU04_05380 [Candidatus Peribacteraceae bacterium]|nr:hypothetical protein [Candidatus Peribacteraceae bacterium]
MPAPKIPETPTERLPASREELAAQLRNVPEEERVRLATDYLEAKTNPVIEATRNALRKLASRIEEAK